MLNCCSILTGHFQYNTAALGLALWSFYFVTRPTFSSCVLGSIVFCLALSFKQMTLYYAPAIFFYLLGRCWRKVEHHGQARPHEPRTLPTDEHPPPQKLPERSASPARQRLDQSRLIQQQKLRKMLQQQQLKLNQQKYPRSSNVFVLRFVLLGLTVLATMALLWWPFVMYGPKNDQPQYTVDGHLLTGDSKTYWGRSLHVLRRIIPLQRGLFEGKVSNLWCALSVKPIRIRKRIPQSIQPLAALALTIAMMAPSCYALFQIGAGIRPPRPENENSERQESNIEINRNSSIDSVTIRNTSRRVNGSKSFTRNDDLTLVLWGMTSCSLAFFLASFQVHEKSILLPLAPACLLFYHDVKFANWFSFLAAWTLWPLVVIDRLQTAYVCLAISAICVMNLVDLSAFSLPIKSALSSERLHSKGCFFDQNIWYLMLHLSSFVVMVTLHFLELSLYDDIPPDMPDLFAVLWSIAGCGMCVLAWIVTVWHLLPTIVFSSRSKFTEGDNACADFTKKKEQ